MVHRLYWYDFVIFFKKQEKIQWKWKNDYIHINLHHLAIWYAKNIFQSTFSSSVLKGNVTFIIKQILRFSKIWITSCIWHVINSLKLNKENIKKWINGLSDMIKDPSKAMAKRGRHLQRHRQKHLSWSFAHFYNKQKQMGKLNWPTNKNSI